MTDSRQDKLGRISAMVAIATLVVVAILVLVSFSVSPTAMIAVLRISMLVAVVGSVTGLVMAARAGLGAAGRKGALLSILILVLVGLLAVYSSSKDMSGTPQVDDNTTAND